MANPKHLAELKKGVEAWNSWREDQARIAPDLSSADLRGANLAGANLSASMLRDTRLDNADLSEANLKGVTAIRASLKDARLFQAVLSDSDFSDADMSRAKLVDAHLFVANLQRANLLKANLSGTDLRIANLSQANLEGADLYGGNLNGAILVEARLNGAYLHETNFVGAVLNNSDFSGANILATVFDNNDLRGVKGLETVRHNGSSVIGILTILRSQGKIPESFLRGCGVPDDFITYAKSLATNPIEFYSCFISYSTKDQDFADRLYADLQNKGVRCWFAPQDVQGGRKLHEQIDEAIRLHDKLLLILSPHSMESEWVKTEIAKARKREVRDPEGVLKRRVLFPIRLAPFETLRDWECFDADTGKDSAREIREYFIPDFSNWKDHDSYQEAFQRLISDLKASDAKAK
ncbi:MAG TPA: toll/interleukin-1 receptor domain-containing protein [Candidatus Acidoferrum sp.]|jgi:uncharacterized protein YjbI with pentapeptide repeats|nr:toll/interleukin-1 receptor domain-containing protein [Candidatus Acidoferrum sp.]